MEKEYGVKYECSACGPGNIRCPTCEGTHIRWFFFSASSDEEAIEIAKRCRRESYVVRIFEECDRDPMRLEDVWRDLIPPDDLEE